jgi:hypothetical protein
VFANHGVLEAEVSLDQDTMWSADVVLRLGLLCAWWWPRIVLEASQGSNVAYMVRKPQNKEEEEEVAFTWHDKKLEAPH